MAQAPPIPTIHQPPLARHLLMHTTLVSTDTLAARLDDAHWLIVDCRFDLTKPAAGEDAYRVGHIPGAIYAHLDRDLSSPITPSSGRHPLPDAERFATTLSAWGISAQTQVVAYDADNGMYASRLWWLLRWVGHRAVAVLDGGLKAWSAAGLRLDTAIPARSPTRFEAHPNRDMWFDAQQVQERVQQPDWRLLDARAPERYAGKVEPLDKVAGHVPGARNHPFATNLTSDARFGAPDELRNRFEQSQAGVADDHTVVMCGSGVTACHALLALEVAGKPGARLYAGSWSEWIRDPARGVATSRD
jgi:thiosulfate/3-mercaptopyruvate sulfurtransferase